MILKHIVEFAETHVGSVPSGYQPRFITKIIQLHADGSLRTILTPAGSTKGKRDGISRTEPQESPARTVGIKPRLIADNVNYALGKAREKDKPEQVQARHAAWRELLAEAAKEIDCAEVKAIHKWMVNGGPEALRDDPRIEEGEELTFEVEGVFPTDLPAVRAWWAGRGEAEFRGQCLITGLEGPIADRMPAPIKGIPDGQMSGTALVSVNNKAGESYGLEAALNSPISVDAAEKLCNGLNYLVNEGSMVPGPDGKERRKLKYGLRVGKSIYIAWTRKDSDFDFWAMFDTPKPSDVQKLLAQPLTGGPSTSVEDEEFYVMALSANAARIIVRDVHETTLGTAKANIARWFKRLSLIGLDGEQLPPVGLYRLAASLYRDANKEMPAHVPTAMLVSALSGRPLPDYLLGLAVKRNLAMQGPYAHTPAKTKALSTTRLALIRATLTPDPEDNTLNHLDTQHKNPAYHCGRMLAVLEAIQRLAARPSKLNATLVDRCYGAACASPASIFGNLLKDATSAHLPKLRRDPARRAAGNALDQRLQEAATAIGHEFPKTLTLKDQGLFALGFYHQKAADLAAAKAHRELNELLDDQTTAPEEVSE